MPFPPDGGPRTLERVRQLALVILFADLTAVAARLSVPFPPVPVTMQTAAVLLSGALLGPGAGAASQLLYLAMGLIGLPVFVGGGGLAYLAAPTFGYLAAFPLAAWAAGHLAGPETRERGCRRLMGLAAAAGLIYLVGLPYLWLNLRFIQHSTLDLGNVVLAGLLVPLPGDCIKVLLAGAMIGSLERVLNRTGCAA